MRSRPETSRTLVHHQILMNEFARRKTRNRAYSLRAFARDLGISLTALSGVLQKRRSLSRKNLEKLSAQIGLPAELRARLKDKPAHVSVDDFVKLEEDRFQLIASWQHLAILNLARLTDASGDPAHVAGRLGISSIEAEACIARLVRLRLLSVDEGRLKRSGKPIEVESKTPSAAIRQYHRENLERALEALESIPMEHREFGAITFPTDPAKLEAARKALFAFKRKLSHALEGASPSEVYTFAFQLFPATQRKAES